MEPPKFTSKFPPFFNLRYLLLELILTALVIVIFYTLWDWHEKRQIEEMRQSIITSCVFDCLTKKAEKNHILSTDPFIWATCEFECQKQRGNYK